MKLVKRLYRLQNKGFRYFLPGLMVILAVVACLQMASPVQARSIKVKPVKDIQTENHTIRLYKQAREVYMKGNKVQARKILIEAAKYDRTGMTPHIHEFLSRIYYELGNPNQAVDEALITFRYDPDKENLLYNLGIYCNEANRHDEAILFLRKYADKTRGEKKARAESLITMLEEEKGKTQKYSSKSPDYLDKLTAEDNVNRWDKSKLPLKVHIEENSSSKGYQPSFPTIARQSFIAWYRASGKKLPFTFVESLEEADINLEWTDKRLRIGDDKKEREKAGLTTSATTSAGEVKKARIQIRTQDPFTKEGTDEDRIKETCLHEIGHSLGLNGHSTNPSDIMYLGTTQRQLPALTKRDKATIAKLYSAYAVVTMAGVKDIQKVEVKTASTQPAAQPNAGVAITGMAAPYTQPPPQYGYYQAPPYYPQAGYQPTAYSPQAQAPYYPNYPNYPNQQYGYTPPVIPQQVPSPYPVNSYPNPNPNPNPYTNQVPMQSQGNMPQPLQMIDNVFQGLKPKIQQFLGNQNSYPNPNQMQPQQYPYQPQPQMQMQPQQGYPYGYQPQ
ncbi:MAG: matrixin family metalloprotease [Candidatus Obscuribacterales bacterium]|nr:matrixin family metalloprotease [Candidatus Obscuribacterales bacterium]